LVTERPLARLREPTLPAEHAQAALARAVQYAEAADAPNTLRAYRSDWQSFVAWCRDAGLAPLPAAPETVGAHLAAHAETHAIATLRRRLVTVARAHKQAGIEGFWLGHPAIRNVMRGIARERGTAQCQASALTTPEIRRLVAVCGDDLAGLRDRALILLGYAAALRRSELVGVDREHLVLDARGLRLTVPRSKGDPEGRGEEIGVPRGKRRETCPIRALEAWLQASDTRYGPMFRWVTRLGHRRAAPPQRRRRAAHPAPPC
jgi:integrase